MMDLLDLIAAEDAKTEALTRVEAHADPGWLEHAEQTIRHLAYTQDSFTTDDVWQILAEMGWDTPHERRALGAVMRKVALSGLIVATGVYKPSARVECHARPVRVWSGVL